jgi:hypothetical protein
MRRRGHADPLSLALQSAYGLKVALSWDPAIMLNTIIGYRTGSSISVTVRVHVLFTWNHV